MQETLWARAGNVLYPARRDAEHCLTDESGTSLFWVKGGTILLVPTRPWYVVRWMAPFGQNLFSQAILWPDGTTEAAEDFLGRLVQLQVWVHVQFVPQDKSRVLADAPAVRWEHQHDPDVGMTRVVPRG